MTQIPGYHIRVMGLRQLVRPLDESQGPSQLHDHGPWLMCEVAVMYVGVIRLIFHVLRLLPTKFTQQNLCCISKSTMKH
jgi:hypothetical protein